MYLNIILTILVSILLAILVALIVWWKKFGKEMFKTLTTMNKIIPNGSNQKNVTNDLSSTLNQAFEMMNKFKNLKR